jgi:hypothetical protein
MPRKFSCEEEGRKESRGAEFKILASFCCLFSVVCAVTTAGKQHALE